MTKLTTTNSIQPSSSLSLLLLAVFAIFFLGSCATLKKSDCTDGNWSGIGFNDAAAGLKSGPQFRAHTKACAKHRIAPNLAVYNTGYQKGLVQFCTTTNGYNRGVSKSEYYGVCPKTSHNNFLKGYLAGLDTATVELIQEISNLRYKRRRAISKHRRAKHHEKSDAKKTKHWIERINNLESRIDSRRNQRRQLRRWHDSWAIKLK